MSIIWVQYGYSVMILVRYDNRVGKVMQHNNAIYRFSNEALELPYEISRVRSVLKAAIQLISNTFFRLIMLTFQHNIKLIFLIYLFLIYLSAYLCFTLNSFILNSAIISSLTIYYFEHHAKFIPLQQLIVLQQFLVLQLK